MSRDISRDFIFTQFPQSVFLVILLLCVEENYDSWCSATLFFFHMVNIKYAHLTKANERRVDEVAFAQSGSADLINKLKSFQGDSEVFRRRFPRMISVSSFEN